MNNSIYTILLIGLTTLGCNSNIDQKQHPISSPNTDYIIDTYLKNGAWNYHYLTKEWDEWINKGIAEDSTIAYLWQQKALPFWKQKKYQQATSYYDKAVQFDRKGWLARRGFLKCIFTKDYTASLIDLKDYRDEFGPTYEQDHSLEFYMSVCYLQLNQYNQAFTILEKEIDQQKLEYGDQAIHYLDQFYLAIALFELKEYNKAISQLDIVLTKYPRFSDAQYYKSLCLHYLNQKNEAKTLALQGKANFENGYTFNEDSSKYEDYPYQITWQWEAIESILN